MQGAQTAEGETILDSKRHTPQQLEQLYRPLAVCWG